MGYLCSVDGVSHYSGLVQICGDLCVGGGDGEVNKVSCTYGCSDHCHGLQHGQVIGVDVSSDISFNVACYSTMAQAGKTREGGRTRRSMAKRVLHGCHITHMGINWKQSTVYKPHHI